MCVSCISDASHPKFRGVGDSCFDVAFLAGNLSLQLSIEIATWVHVNKNSSTSTLPNAAPRSIANTLDRKAIASSARRELTAHEKAARAKWRRSALRTRGGGMHAALRRTACAACPYPAALRASEPDENCESRNVSAQATSSSGSQDRNSIEHARRSRIQRENAELALLGAHAASSAKWKSVVSHGTTISSNSVVSSARGVRAELRGRTGQTRKAVRAEHLRRLWLSRIREVERRGRGGGQSAVSARCDALEEERGHNQQHVRAKFQHAAENAANDHIASDLVVSPASTSSGHERPSPREHEERGSAEARIARVFSQRQRAAASM